LKLSSKQTELLGGKTDPSQIYPEYYVIKVNNFDDIAKDSLDQWIYYLKNNEIKDDFNAKGIGKAKELWRVDNLPENERKNYLKHIDDLHYEASMAWSMKVDAKDQIRKEKKIQIAKELKKNGVAIDMIVKSTGLTKTEIEKL
jgi:predicted transposase/invertase (TIGR01784 family)